MQLMESKVEMAFTPSPMVAREKGDTSGRTKSRGVVLVIARMTQS
jgi:hypothetical protein